MFAPKKELGQNFLSDPEIATSMISGLDITAGNDVIEIGPGRGFLTEQLAKKAVAEEFDFYAVELDKRFYEHLQRTFVDNPNVHIVNANILDFLPKYTKPENKSVKILGSLPYYITSPIVHQIIRMAVSQPDECVLLIQKEVAEKIVAPAPDSSYMSVFVQTFFEVTYLFTIPREKFSPVPQVDGGVIKLVKRSELGKEFGVDLTREFVTKYEGFLHKAFKNPRKMMNKPFSQEELDRAGISASLRPQNLNWKEWLNFYLKF